MYYNLFLTAGVHSSLLIANFGDHHVSLPYVASLLTCSVFVEYCAESIPKDFFRIA